MKTIKELTNSFNYYMTTNIAVNHVSDLSKEKDLINMFNSDI